MCISSNNWVKLPSLIFFTSATAGDCGGKYDESMKLVLFKEINRQYLKEGSCFEDSTFIISICNCLREWRCVLQRFFPAFNDDDHEDIVGCTTNSDRRRCEQAQVFSHHETVLSNLRKHHHGQDSFHTSLFHQVRETFCVIFFKFFSADFRGEIKQSSDCFAPHIHHHATLIAPVIVLTEL